MKHSKSLQELRDIATTWQEVNPTGKEAISILRNVVSNAEQHIQELKAIKAIAESRIEEIEWSDQGKLF